MRYYRSSINTIAIASVFLAGITASAQQSGGGLSAEQRDIGRVETRI